MKRNGAARGFTLVELMVTVVIIAILGLVAAVSYSRYVRKARITEAINFLADIKMKQETYYQTYGSYVDTSAAPASHGAGDFYPQTLDMGHQKWDIVCPDDADSYPGWCALGSRPNPVDDVNFQYVTVGWQNGDPAPPSEYIRDPDRRWWYAVALGVDRDKKDTVPTFLFTNEISSVSMWNEVE